MNTKIHTIGYIVYCICLFILLNFNFRLSLKFHYIITILYYFLFLIVILYSPSSYSRTQLVSLFQLHIFYSIYSVPNTKKRKTSYWSNTQLRQTLIDWQFPHKFRSKYKIIIKEWEQVLAFMRKMYNLMQEAQTCIKAL